MTMTSTRPLVPGVYAASLTFFDSTENLNRESQRKYAIRLGESGCTGIVAMGSNGEAPHLLI